MYELTVRQGTACTRLSFEGTPILADLLAEHGFPVQRPCGGRGKCGKCAVEVSGCLSQPTAAEVAAGAHLACQTALLGDAQVTLPDAPEHARIELSGEESFRPLAPVSGCLGLAVDIGTTTLAARLLELSTGKTLGQAAMLNPQTAVAADVMGRIGAALEGKLALLQHQILQALEALLNQACQQAHRDPAEVDVLSIAGNTTMLYLLTGRNPESLSHAPFEADCLFGQETTLLGRRTLLPPCMNAFVGADITCAVLAAGQCLEKGPSLLCDVGTNGEIALWKDGVLYVTSTAAGPAFEGAGISCGCGSIPGAIDQVSVENAALQVHTIDEATPAGVCGSGLIDAIAALLQLEIIDETGAADEDEIPLSGGVSLLSRDIRAVQLAKAAVAAGIDTLLETAGVAPEALTHLSIAGGFGSHLRVASAVAIGLIPPSLAQKVRILGNASLTGACRLLMDAAAQSSAAEIARRSQHVSLGGNPRFNHLYVEHMLFPEQE